MQGMPPGDGDGDGAGVGGGLGALMMQYTPSTVSCE